MHIASVEILSVSLIETLFLADDNFEQRTMKILSYEHVSNEKRLQYDWMCQENRTTISMTSNFHG